MDQKILIIDAHPVYAKKIMDFLEGLTFKNINLAKTGEEGIREVKAQNPDIVILSGMLPDMGSVEVCREIKEITGAATRVIVQTGLFFDENDVSFLRNGANVVLDRKEKDLMPLQKAIEASLSSS